MLNYLKSMIYISDKVCSIIANNKDLVSKIVKPLHEMKKMGVLRTDMVSNKTAESAKSAIHYYSQSSSHPMSQKSAPSLPAGQSLNIVIKDLLEIVSKLVTQANVAPCKFLERYNLPNVLYEIYHHAKKNNLVILEKLSLEILEYGQQQMDNIMK